jgi:hypothetical protein
MDITDLKKHSHKQRLAEEAAQRYLRSYGRKDIIRQKVGFLGWTLSRWLLLLANTVVIRDHGKLSVLFTESFLMAYWHVQSM